MPDTKRSPVVSWSGLTPELPGSSGQERGETLASSEQADDPIVGGKQGAVLPRPDDDSLPGM